MWDMKVEKRKKINFYILGYIPKLIIKIWQFGKKHSSKPEEFGLSFLWKTLCVGKNLAKFHHIALGGDALKLS